MRRNLRQLLIRAIFTIAVLIPVSSLTLADPPHARRNPGRWNLPIGDIEGIETRIVQLLAEGKLILRADGHYELHPDYNFHFQGDLMKRGPYGMRAIRIALDLLDRYKDPNDIRVTGVLGNHDLNSLKLMLWIPKFELDEVPDYRQWRQKNNRVNDLISQIDYWAEYNGLQDKIAWFWYETVADHFGVDPIDPQFKKTYSANGKPDLTALSQVFSKEVIYNKFYDFVKPGGPLWELYAKFRAIKIYEATQGMRALFFHSGVLTKGNFGVVPGDAEADLLHRMKNDPRYRGIDFEAIGNYFTATDEALLELKAKQPGIFWEAIRVWVNEYNDWMDDQLEVMKREFFSLKGQDGRKPLARTAENSKAADRLYHNTLGVLSDAGWDPATQKLQTDANSLFYPDSRVAKGSSIPGLPEAPILRFMALANLPFQFGGHIPIGDGMIHRSAWYFDYLIQFLMTDTSFSPIEQTDHLMIRDDGYVEFRAVTRTGQAIRIERPGMIEMSLLRQRVNLWSAQKAAFMKHLESVTDPVRRAELEKTKADFEETTKRVAALDYLGKLADGWLVIGFDEKTLPGGSKVPDYDKYVLFQKQGFKMNYKTTDIWGLQLAKITIATADLSEMARQARAAKKAELKQHGRNVLSDDKYRQAIAGRKVMVVSGPAATSMNKALNNPLAVEVATQFEIDFRNRLMATPASDKLTIITGGTTGFEQIVTRVVKKVNRSRRAQVAEPIHWIGTITGVTGMTELDPSSAGRKIDPSTSKPAADDDYDPYVNDYYRLNAFYWDDYFPELLHSLFARTVYLPTSIEFFFAGGGGIVTNQIKQTLAYSNHKAFKGVQMLKGLTESMTEPKKISATDKFLMGQEAPQWIASGLVRVVDYHTATNVIPLRPLPNAMAPTVSQSVGPRCEELFRRAN